MFFAGTIAWFWGGVCVLGGWGNCLIVSGKTYIIASWLLAKPVVITWGARTLWTGGVFFADWFSGRLYADNCIGEGIMGMYNHFWNMLSPACTAFLLSHFIYMGVFVASFLCTTMVFAFWAFKNMKDHEYTKEISGLIYNRGVSIPNGWEIKKTTDGKTYYVNHMNSTTQWEPPSSNDCRPPSYQRPPVQQQQAYNGSYNGYNSNSY